MVLQVIVLALVIAFPLTVTWLAGRAAATP
jgi:hypothetical protein